MWPQGRKLAPQPSPWTKNAELSQWSKMQKQELVPVRFNVPFGILQPSTCFCASKHNLSVGRRTQTESRGCSSPKALCLPQSRAPVCAFLSV